MGNRESHKNMRLSREAIVDFKKIFKQEFGDDLTDAEAEDHALRLLRVFKNLQDLPEVPIDNLSVDRNMKTNTS